MQKSIYLVALSCLFQPYCAQQKAGETQGAHLMDKIPTDESTQPNNHHALMYACRANDIIQREDYDKRAKRAGNAQEELLKQVFAKRLLS